MNLGIYLRQDELTSYIWSRHADGTVEYVSPDGCEYLGVAPRDILDFTRFIHPEDVDIRQRAMEQVKQTVPGKVSCGNW
jgi:hypothetical protein